MIVIDRKSPWILELAWLLAFLAEPGHERAIVARECLHSIVVVGDEQETSMMVELKAERGREQAIGIGWLLGANRELDSSISIKKKRRIVSHCGGGKCVTMCDSASEYTSESSEVNTTYTRARASNNLTSTRRQACWLVRVAARSLARRLVAASPSLSEGVSSIFSRVSPCLVRVERHLFCRCGRL